MSTTAEHHFQQLQTSAALHTVHTATSCSHNPLRLEGATATGHSRWHIYPDISHNQMLTNKQTSIGTGYDLSNSVFSPDGRNFQVEYAVKAVENGGTCIGIRTKHGVVLACEKIISSKLLKPGANKRISSVDRNAGVVTSGLVPDGRHLASRARDEANSWRSTYKAPIPISALASRVGGYVQAYTLYSSVRPFGVTAILGGWDSEAELGVDGQVGAGPTLGTGGKVDDDSVKKGGPGLYMIEPSGLYWVRATRCLLLPPH
jgi:20S proteasome subunit alpha 7